MSALRFLIALCGGIAAVCGLVLSQPATALQCLHAGPSVIVVCRQGQCAAAFKIAWRLGGDCTGRPVVEAPPQDTTWTDARLAEHIDMSTANGIYEVRTNQYPCAVLENFSNQERCRYFGAYQKLSDTPDREALAAIESEWRSLERRALWAVYRYWLMVIGLVATIILGPILWLQKRRKKNPPAAGI